MLKPIQVLWLILNLWVPTELFAEQKNWQNEVDLGMLLYNGNNNAKHLNATLLSEYQRFSFENSFKVTGLLAVGRNTQTNDKERHAEKYTLTESIHYVFTPSLFSYLRGQGVRDHFAAYSYELTESVGYGYKVFDKDKLSLEMSGGPGARHSKVVLGARQNEWIGHLETAFFYEITTHSSFKQNLTIDSSQKNTKTHILNELKTAILGPVAAKVSFDLEHYSKLPKKSSFSRKTDATTKVTLSYNF